MILTISFTVNTDKIPAYNATSEKDVAEALMNVGMLLAKLQQDIPMRKLKILSSKHDDELKDALIKNIEIDEKFVEQIFNDYKIEGTLKNGKSFIFTHKEPGYKEELTWKE